MTTAQIVEVPVTIRLTVFVKTIDSHPDDHTRQLTSSFNVDNPVMAFSSFSLLKIIKSYPKLVPVQFSFISGVGNYLRNFSERIIYQRQS